MFTIKFYSDDGCRQRIFEAESFTILRAPSNPANGGKLPVSADAEITLHQKSGDDFRVDIGATTLVRSSEWPPIFGKAIIENAAGRTTEIIMATTPRMA